MVYELWETESGNLMGSYLTQQEALSVVREAIALHGQAYVESIALVAESEPEEEHLVQAREAGVNRLIPKPQSKVLVARSMIVAQGKELAKLARSTRSRSDRR